MTYNHDIHDASQLNRFASAQWEKTLAFLQNRFGIPEDDCKDIFQEAFIVFYNLSSTYKCNFLGADNKQ